MVNICGLYIPCGGKFIRKSMIFRELKRQPSQSMWGGALQSPYALLSYPIV